MTEDAVVPNELLLEFLRRGAQTLDQLAPLPGPAESLVEIRQHLLQAQSSCLQSIVDQYNRDKSNEVGSLWLTPARVQVALRSCCSDKMSPWIDMERCLNEAARLAFARLVLYSECLWELKEEPVRRARESRFQNSGELSDDDAQTFCGLCRAVVQLPNVQQHLRHQEVAIFADLPQSGDQLTVFPQKRLEYIQRLFMKAIGYDPDFATRVIQTKFFRDTNNTDGDNKNNLDSIFRATLTSMEVALSEATAGSTFDTHYAEPSSTIWIGDNTACTDDGVTKVVAVQYSEKLIDAETGEELLTTTCTTGSSLNEGASPRIETMVDAEREPQQSSVDDPTEAPATTTDRHRQQQVRLAQQASALQQEILGELLNLCDEEREVKLALAREASETLQQRLLELPPGSERVALLTSVDPTTQRLLAMYKVWEGMHAAHG